MQSRAVERDAAILARATPQERGRVERVPLLNGGIHTEKAPNDLAPNEVSKQLNLHIVAGRLAVDTGYVPFAQTFIGFPQAAIQAVFSDTTSVELLITSLYVYTFSALANQWQLASRNSIRSVTLGYGPGATSFAIDDDSDIVVGQLIGISMASGTQFISTVAALPAPGVVDTDDPIPAGQLVTLGADFFVGVTLSGDPALSQVCWVLFPANNWIIFSNGVDPIQYYFQGVVTELGGLPSETTCAAMWVFHSMLLIGNTVEAGTRFPTRVRQSGLADPEEWTPGGGTIAAIYDLLDTPDDVLNLKTLGPWIICYRGASIMRGSFIGALNEVIFWEYMSQEDGAQSQGSVCDVGTSHVVVGTNNVYEYKGGYDLPAIGDGIFENFLAKDGDLYAPGKETIFTVYVPTLREVWILYPSTQIASERNQLIDFPSKMLRYDTTLRAWSERVFADEFIAAGQYTPQTTITWATAPGQWNSSMWARPWASKANLANVPNVFLCPSTQNQLFIYDFTALTDAGAEINFEIVTRQYGDGGEFTRWERVVLTGTGAVFVQYSITEQLEWVNVGAVDMGFTTAVVRTVWLDLVSTRLQLRLTGINGFFSLRYADIYAEFDSEW